MQENDIHPNSRQPHFDIALRYEYHDGNGKPHAFDVPGVFEKRMLKMAAGRHHIFLKDWARQRVTVYSKIGLPIRQKPIPLERILAVNIQEDGHKLKLDQKTPLLTLLCLPSSWGRYRCFHVFVYRDFCITSYEPIVLIEGSNHRFNLIFQ